MLCHTYASFAILALFVANPFVVSSNSVSPVQKVIQLIEDMEGKVQRDQAAASNAFEANAKNCDDVAVKKGYAIKDAKSDIESLSATVEDEDAKISEYGTKIEEVSSQISASEQELSKAISVRDGEVADFKKVESDLVTTVDQLSGAHANLKKTLGGASFAQVAPDAKRALDKSLKALSMVVEASFVTHAQRSKVQAFIETRANAEDDLSFTSVATGNGGSDAILETLEEMQDKAEGTLSDTRKADMEKGHAFAMVRGDLENELKSRQKELAEATHAKQVSAEALAQADKDLASTKAALKDDSHYVQDLHKKCMFEAQEWEVTNRDSVAELTALDKAKAILSKKFGALIQSRSHQRLKLHLSTKDDAKTRALRAIQQLGKRFHSTALVSLAYRAAADPFAKVRGMVEDMIAKLMQEAAEEADKKALCDKDISESKATKADKDGKIAKLDARIEKAEAAIAELTEGISALSKEIAETNAAVTEATAIREEEKSVFLVAEKDLAESEDACAAAIEVLREYYEGGSLVQVGSKTAAKTSSEGNDGSGILGVLELAESDFAQNLAEIRSAEKVEVDEYNALMQDSKMNLAVKEIELKGKESEVKSVKVGLRDNSADKEGLSTELDAVLEFLDMRTRQCETKVPSYAERKAAREAEIEGLKEALTILGA